MRRMTLVVLALVLALGLVPAGSVLADSEPVPNFGFIPNSYEASVSRVDLVSHTEVARYYTAPREAESGIDVRSWRTNRMTLDAEGNGWVLNTGADAFRHGPDEGLQGQVVRIQADTEGLANTHEYPDAVLDFGTDDAVQVFDVGDVDDMPRAIAIDADGHIWVGFYGNGELHRYSYDGTNLNLEADYSPDPQIIRYYDMAFAPDGDLFISSRDSTPSVSGDFGIWRFDGDDFHHEQDFDSPYALVADDGTVYATSYNDILRIRDLDGSWSQVTITGAQNLRGMAFDGPGKLWITSTTAHTGGIRVCWYDPDDGTSGFIELKVGNTPVGIDRDAAGIMWVVCRTDDEDNGYLEGFNPADGSFVAAIEVGPRPYVYRDFVLPVFSICGFKYHGDTGEGLEGWEIILDKWVQDAWVEVGRIDTGPNGEYCFTGLLAGEYRVSEILKPGWTQVYPGGRVHIVNLPEGTSDPDDGPFYNFENRRIPAVGGAGFPVSRLSLLIPWIALLVAILAGAALLVRRPRKA